MNEISAKSVQTLELESVLQMLASQCVSAESKQRALSLAPDTDKNHIRRLQEQTSAAVAYITRYGSPPFSGIRDIRPAMLRAQKGGVLNNRELLDLSSLLGTARAVQKYCDDDDQLSTCIDQLFNSLAPNRYLEDKINKAIISEDEIADESSPALSDIRRHIRNTTAKAETLCRG